MVRVEVRVRLLVARNIVVVGNLQRQINVNRRCIHKRLRMRVRERIVTHMMMQVVPLLAVVGIIPSPFVPLLQVKNRQRILQQATLEEQRGPGQEQVRVRVQDPQIQVQVRVQGH